MREYTTRHSNTFHEREEAEHAFSALSQLESDRIDLPDGLAWLIENEYATEDQPSTHDEGLIRLSDGTDIQWFDRGQWEPGLWFYS